MPRLSIGALTPRVERTEGPRTFTDPSQPGVELVLTFRSLGPTRSLLINDEADAIRAKFGAEDEQGGIPFLPVPGHRIQMGRQLAQTIAVLMALQVPDPGEEPYGVVEWAAFIDDMPTAAEQIATWAETLRRTPLPNSTPAAATSSTSAAGTGEATPT